MNSSADLHQLFPEVEPLLVQSARDIDDHILLFISRQGDRFGVRSDEALPVLQSLRDTGNAPEPSDDLSSVALPLSLMAVQPLSHLHPSPASFSLTELQVQLARLWASAALTAYGERFRERTNQAAIGACVATARQFGSQVNAALAHLLIDLLQTSSPCWSRHALSLLVVATRLSPPASDAPNLGWIAGMAMSEEAHFAGMMYDYKSGKYPMPLLPFGLPPDIWNPLGDELSAFASTVANDQLRTMLERCAAIGLQG